MELLSSPTSPTSFLSSALIPASPFEVASTPFPVERLYFALNQLFWDLPHQSSPPANPESETEAAMIPFKESHPEIPGLDTLSPVHLEAIIAQLLENAKLAVVALMEGQNGPFSLGFWSRAIFNALVNRVPRFYRLRYRQGEILFYGDPQGPHERTIGRFTDAVANFLQPRCSSPHTWQAVTIDEVKTHGDTDAKEADQSWALTLAGEIDTVLEVVWCNETTSQFILEVQDWHAARRNVIGVRLFWNGKTGKEALETGSTHYADAADSASVFLVAQGVDWQQPKVWRLGPAAQAHPWDGPVDEQPGTVACLPSAWFIADRSVPPMVPIFLASLQDAVGEGIHVLSGHPPLSLEESRQSLRRLREGQVAALNVPLPGISASKRQRLLAIAQERLARLDLEEQGGEAEEGEESSEAE